jgi:hypothetical protein
MNDFEQYFKTVSINDHHAPVRFCKSTITHSGNLKDTVKINRYFHSISTFIYDTSANIALNIS